MKSNMLTQSLKIDKKIYFDFVKSLCDNFNTQSDILNMFNLEDNFEEDEETPKIPDIKI